MIELNLTYLLCACGHIKTWHSHGICEHEDCIKDCTKGFSHCPFFLHPDEEYNAITLACWQGW
jgi:hypothetical protein